MARENRDCVPLTAQLNLLCTPFLVQWKRVTVLLGADLETNDRACLKAGGRAAERCVARLPGGRGRLTRYRCRG